MLKPALRIAAVLAALLSPSLAPAQSYELLREEAGEQRRAVCFGEQAASEYLRALHFQMNVLAKSHWDATIAIGPRVNGDGDIDCHFITSTARFERPPNIIDVVELDGLGPWTEFEMFGLEARTVTNYDGRVLTREMASFRTVYVIVSDTFVRKRP